MAVKTGRVIVAALMALLVLYPALVFAGPDDVAKEAAKIIRNAERNMFNGKNEEADAMLNEALSLIEQVKAEDPANKRIMQAEKDYARIRKNVDKKLGRTATKPSSSGPALPPKPEAKSMPAKSGEAAPASEETASAKLPGGVKKRLQDITGHLNSAEDYAGRDAKKAEYKLEQAAGLFEEIDRMYGGQFDPGHPDYAAVQERYNDLTNRAAAQGAAEEKEKAAAAEAAAAKKEQSEEWVAKFREYLSYPGIEGHNPDKLVFVPGTSEPEKFAEAQKRFEAFKAFYEEYKKTEFPNGRTWELEDLADNQAPLRIKNFTEEFGDRVASVSGNAEREIDAAMVQLDKDNGWKSDKTVKPNLVDHKWMDSIREAVEKVVAALGEGDPKRQEVQAKFDALVAKDKENRQIRKERTFMTPDRYSGADIDALKDKAKSLVKNDAKEGGAPLRCTIISENWKEETVEEWTDTSRTTWRIRTTRSLTGQVAAKTADGVRLITVALAKDKQSDGSWGPLYGNLHQYSDPMLEENVNK